MAEVTAAMRDAFRALKTEVTLPPLSAQAEDELAYYNLMAAQLAPNHLTYPPNLSGAPQYPKEQIFRVKPTTKTKPGTAA
jgi:hypothetical protein